ncbi:MAG TPA: superinfection immunity protein [Gammaproteobacteria bacterium]|nr:superinfection immunity protein [Gammaproteobacteria bacterium]
MQHFTVLVESFHSVGFLLIVGAFWFAAYLSPAIMAYVRHHQNEFAILVMNVLLGWTVLGWITALVWAATPVQVPRAPAPRQPPQATPESGRKEPVIDTEL